jgi:hypothetical protein
MTHEVVGACQGETRMSEHIGISPAEEGWTVANDNETCLVVALDCTSTNSIFTKARAVLHGMGGNRGGQPWLDGEIWGSRPRRFAVVLPYCSSTPQITQNARTRTTCVCFVVNRLELGRAAADRAGAAY